MPCIIHNTASVNSKEKARLVLVERAATISSRETRTTDGKRIQRAGALKAHSQIKIKN